MKRSTAWRIGPVAATALVVVTPLATSGCTTTYTGGELAAQGQEEAHEATSEESYDKEVTEEGGDNVEATDEEIEWNVDNEDR
jgi:hypothetical protein